MNDELFPLCSLVSRSGRNGSKGWVSDGSESDGCDHSGICNDECGTGSDILDDCCDGNGISDLDSGIGNDGWKSDGSGSNNSH